MSVQKIPSYAGIGSRKVPQAIGRKMTKMAKMLRNKGFILRSGAAPGSDSFFEAGAGIDKEIYLPWNNYQGNPSGLVVNNPLAFEIAKKYHPDYSKLSQGAQKLMARNSHQILGLNLNDPVKFVICWTPDGCQSHEGRSNKTGGTGQAISIASDLDIPIYNLRNEDSLELLEQFF